ncbi:apolipoprotein L2-like [Mus pahari]|uniref:apolipoprotein L2-like n=1 Tax=Mus pahari TaxID=10093 RepID=UPI000A30CBE4|nr:apolipoprotein L2-like [Mus pahari]
MGTPDRECYIETVAEYLLDVRSTEDLQLLLTEEEAWKQFVAEVDLSREEEAAVREALAEIFAGPDGEDEDELQNDKTQRYSAKDPGMKEVLDQSGPRLLSLSMNSFKKLKNIKDNIRAIKLIKANPSLVTNTKRLMTTGKTSTETTKQVKEAFGGTALAMSKGTQIMGAAVTGLFLLLDMVSLVGDSKHLREGAKAESAAELRHQAQDLEQKLQELIRVHDSLIQ